MGNQPSDQALPSSSRTPSGAETPQKSPDSQPETPVDGKLESDVRVNRLFQACIEAPPDIVSVIRRVHRTSRRLLLTVSL